MVAVSDTDILMRVGSVEQARTAWLNGDENIILLLEAVATLAVLSHLAVNDDNKPRLMRGGIIRLCTDIMKSDGHQACSSDMVRRGLLFAVKIVWQIGFLEKTRLEIIDKHTDCLNALKSLKTHEDKEIVCTVDGALWVLSGEAKNQAKVVASQKAKPAAPAQDEDTPHVMLSYCWAQKPIIVRLNTELKKFGYKVWIDVNDMRKLVTH